MPIPESNHIRLRVAFIGFSFDLVSLGNLRTLQHTHRLVGVIDTFPLRPLIPVQRMTSFGAVARESGADYMVLHPRNQRELVAFLKRVKPDILCVSRCDYLLRPSVFNLPPLGALNVHSSLLPKFRGRDPIYWQYREMDHEGGVTIHRIDERMDTGDILQQEGINIPLGTPFRDLAPSYDATASRLLLRALAELAEGTAHPRAQRHLPSPVIARGLVHGEPVIDWEHWPIERVWHVLRGFPTRCMPRSTFYEWQVGGFNSEPTGGTPGRLQVDRSGYYLEHNEGQIRVERRVSMKHTLRSTARLAYRRALATP